MELIRYRKTLDVHKNGTQFLLQGFETADNMSRVIEISLMASGDAIDFPLERIVAMMYVTTPGATEPSINECTIKDNKIIYNVLPIAKEGITTMQLKLIETTPDGATSVLASPKFAVEVTKSNADDESAEQTTTFTALEDAMAKAKTVYDERFLRMELSSDCIFRAYYADGSVYETDILKKIFLNGNALLSESFAHGGTGVRASEDTDNSKYYSNVSKSEALNAKAIMEDSEEILEVVKLHGVYTAFQVDFTTGEVEYVSPSFKFKVNLETGDLDAEGQTYTFNDEIGRVVEEWLASNNVVLADLQTISKTHTNEIVDLKEITTTHTEELAKTLSIEKGGTGATTKEEARSNLEVAKHEPWNIDTNVGKINAIDGNFVVIGNVAGQNVEESYSVIMKNSGKLYLKFTSYFVAKGETWATKNVNVSIMVDGNVIKEYLNEETYTEYVVDGTIGRHISVPHNVLLEVNKGNVVTIRASHSPTLSDYNTELQISNISLYADITTPYIYGSLNDADEITATDILNALTGGAE